MRLRYYTLDADHRIVETDMMTWATAMKSVANRLVARTEFDDIAVSTVFVGLDHRYHGNGPPLVFETMIFGGELDMRTWRYSSWDDAEAGHAAAVRKVRDAIRQKTQ